MLCDSYFVDVLLQEFVVSASGKKEKNGKKIKKNQCQECIGLCCRYFALPIEDPEDWDDYDDIRWYLCHEDVTVFLEDGDWYLNIRNKCKYLSQDDYKCEKYDMRPKICRGYRTKDCDFTNAEYNYELHFKSDKQMEEYMKIKFGEKVFENLKPRRKKTKRRK